MKLIVGLGNPGVKYEKTRHNAGFMVLDRIAEMNGVSISKNKFEGKHVKTKINGEDVILLKPETFMNLSGFSVRACMDFYKISRKDLLIIYDDLDTPVGSIRLKAKGSAGGHNGMKSVIQSVLGEDFNRIRVGIGRDPKIKIIDYVLTRFRAEELEDLDQSIDQAAKAAIFSLTHSFEQTMNRYNGKIKTKSPKKTKSKLETYQSTEIGKTYKSKNQGIISLKETDLSPSALSSQVSSLQSEKSKISFQASDLLQEDEIVFTTLE